MGARAPMRPLMRPLLRALLARRQVQDRQAAAADRRKGAREQRGLLDELLPKATGGTHDARVSGGVGVWATATSVKGSQGVQPASTTASLHNSGCVRACAPGGGAPGAAC